MLDKLTANISRTNDDDVPPIASGTEQKGIALARFSRPAPQTGDVSKASQQSAVQFVSTTLSVPPRQGAFTGATGARAGLLKAADGGMFFLDEIGELGTDEQAMLVRAIEENSASSCS